MTPLSSTTDCISLSTSVTLHVYTHTDGYLPARTVGGGWYARNELAMYTPHHHMMPAALVAPRFWLPSARKSATLIGLKRTAGRALRETCTRTVSCAAAMLHSRFS